MQQMFLNIQPSSPKWKNQSWPGVGWTMDSMTRVHLYVAPVIDLFGKVFEEIVLRLSLNRFLASFTLIDLAAFTFFQETWIAEIESCMLLNRSSTFYLIFPSSTKQLRNVIYATIVYYYFVYFSNHLRII